MHTPYNLWPQRGVQGTCHIQLPGRLKRMVPLKRSRLKNRRTAPFGVPPPQKQTNYIHLGVFFSRETPQDDGFPLRPSQITKKGVPTPKKTRSIAGVSIRGFPSRSEKEPRVPPPSNLAIEFRAIEAMQKKTRRPGVISFESTWNARKAAQVPGAFSTQGTLAARKNPAEAKTWVRLRLPCGLKEHQEHTHLRDRASLA